MWFDFLGYGYKTYMAMTIRNKKTVFLCVLCCLHTHDEHITIIENNIINLLIIDYIFWNGYAIKDSGMIFGRVSYGKSFGERNEESEDKLYDAIKTKTVVEKKTLTTRKLFSSSLSFFLYCTLNEWMSQSHVLYISV